MDLTSFGLPDRVDCAFVVVQIMRVVSSFLDSIIVGTTTGSGECRRKLVKPGRSWEAKDTGTTDHDHKEPDTQQDEEHEPAPPSALVLGHRRHSPHRPSEDVRRRRKSIILREGHG